MPCGCAEVCTCFLSSSDTVAVTGSGTSATPWVPVVIVDPEGGLQTGAAGVAILIDPASTLPFSFGPDGLLLECCPAAVMDSDTIDFEIAGGAVTGEVILDPDAGLESTGSGVGILLDPASTADVSLSASGLRVDIDDATVVAAAFETGDYKYRAAATSSDPEWLLCDGTSELVAAQPGLFALIGYTFGGAGANFNRPDFRGRGPIHPGTHLDVNAMGDNDGLAIGSRTPNHAHAAGTLSGITAATSAAAALTVGSGTLQSYGVNDDIAGGEAWLNVTTAVVPASPAVPTNNNSGDGEGPGSSGDVPLTNHTHGIAAVGVAISGATALNTTPFLVGGYWFIRA